MRLMHLMAESQNKIAAEIVPIGAGPDTFVMWERGEQELENIEGVKEGARYFQLLISAGERSKSPLC